jgi:single stranded DNA-binding protein
MEIVTIIGNLGKDVELKESKDGYMVKLSVACSGKTKNKKGEWEEFTTWYNVIKWINKQQKNYYETFFKKGDKVFVVGDYQQEIYYSEKGERKLSNNIFAHQLLGFN